VLERDDGVGGGLRGGERRDAGAARGHQQVVHPHRRRRVAPRARQHGPCARRRSRRVSGTRKRAVPGTRPDATGCREHPPWSQAGRDRVPGPRTLVEEAEVVRAPPERLDDVARALVAAGGAYRPHPDQPCAVRRCEEPAARVEPAAPHLARSALVLRRARWLAADAQRGWRCGRGAVGGRAGSGPYARDLRGTCRGTRRVRLVRGEGRGVST
jgi:hypothetical protein